MHDVEMGRSYEFNTAREIRMEDTTKSLMFEDLKNAGKDLGDSMNQRQDTKQDTISMNKTARSGFLSSRKSNRNPMLDQLRNTLYYDSRTHSIPKTAIKNPVVEEILAKGDSIVKNPKLHESIIKLRELDLLKKNEPFFKKYAGIGKVGYVYNDYHSRSTNPGYSRNTGGNFYYR